MGACRAVDPAVRRGGNKRHVDVREVADSGSVERDPVANTPAEFASFLETDARQWERVIRDAKMQKIE